MIRALLWDVDGTLAETERDGHRVAFNLAFEALGLPWRWDESHYGRLLRIAGGRERLLADMASRPQAPVAAAERAALAGELHRRKNGFYARRVADGAVQLRAGVRELVEEAAAAGVHQALVTTTSRANAQALLAHHFGDRAPQLFSVLVCGEDVAAKKPHPEAYERALARLALKPLEALAIEDAPGGVAAAQAAGVPVLVTRSAYFADDVVEGVVAVGPGLGTRAGWRPAARSLGRERIGVDDLRDWHVRMELVSSFG